MHQHNPSFHCYHITDLFKLYICDLRLLKIATFIDLSNGVLAL